MPTHEVNKRTYTSTHTSVHNFAYTVKIKSLSDNLLALMSNKVRNIKQILVFLIVSSFYNKIFIAY